MQKKICPHAHVFLVEEMKTLINEMASEMETERVKKGFFARWFLLPYEIFTLTSQETSDPPCVCVCVLSHVWLFMTPWTVACQIPLSRQESWSRLPVPSSEDLPDRGIKSLSPASPELQVDSLPLSPTCCCCCCSKSLQSCLTLCDPIDSSPPGSADPGILPARVLEWVAISFSKAWKWKVKVKSLSRVRLSATPWTAAYQAPPSMGFSRQEYWSGVPLPSPKVCPRNA